MQALVGSGVLMQPSLLFNAVSLPTLHSAAATSSDISVSLTGSMPVLAAIDNCCTESSDPYWRSQQGKAQLVAQHSSEATTTPTIGNNSVDFTLGSTDLDTTIGSQVQQATVGNDLYMAEGIDLDMTEGSVVNEDSVELNETLIAASAECELSEEQSCDVTSNNSASHQPHSSTLTPEHDRQDTAADASGPSVDEDDSASWPAAVEHAVETAAAAASSMETSEDVTLISAADKDKASDGPSVDRDDAIGLSVGKDDNVAGLSVVTSADDAAAVAMETSEDVTPINAADSCSWSAERVSLSHCTDDNTHDDQLNASSSTSLPRSSSADMISSQSVIDMKKSESADSDVVKCVVDMVDELSVVIPSSCDSVSDDSDERYVSGQPCTLREFIAESNSSEHSTAAAAAPLQLSQSQESRQRATESLSRQRALGVSEIDSPDSDVAGRPMTTGDKSTTSGHQRLISVVSDDTVQFIGAKEKLRRQLSYAGHFYRSVIHPLLSCACDTVCHVCTLTLMMQHIQRTELSCQIYLKLFSVRPSVCIKL